MSFSAHPPVANKIVSPSKRLAAVHARPRLLLSVTLPSLLLVTSQRVTLQMTAKREHPAAVVTAARLAQRLLAHVAGQAILEPKRLEADFAGEEFFAQRADSGDRPRRPLDLIC